MPSIVRVTALAAAGGIFAGCLAACARAASMPQASAAHPQPAASGASPRPRQSGGAHPIRHARDECRECAAARQGDGRRAGRRGHDAAAVEPRPNAERPIGSITKVMTALVVIEAGGLNRPIRIPRAVLRYVAKYQGESAGLHPGDVLTPRELLEALLLESGCDAAYVLATTYGPGIPAFLAKMNAIALKLGMTHTHFTSPDGLPYPTEYSTYSTPADLLTLGIAAMKLPVFRSIVGQSFYHLAKKRGLHHAYWWDNTNDLIDSYRGADGIKTGYTDAAKHCLLFEAVRHGMTLIGVVLGSPTTGPASAAQAATRMLNWGFGLKLAAAAGSG